MRNLGLVAPGFVLWQSAALAQTETIATSAGESSAPDNGTTGVVVLAVPRAGPSSRPTGVFYLPLKVVVPS